MQPVLVERFARLLLDVQRKHGREAWKIRVVLVVVDAEGVQLVRDEVQVVLLRKIRVSQQRLARVAPAKGVLRGAEELGVSKCVSVMT
jgi:hypothetical protein